MPGSQEDREYKVKILAFKVAKGYFGVELEQILRLCMYATEEVSNARNNVAKIITVLTKDKERFPMIDLKEVLGLAKPERERRIEERSTVIVVKSDSGPMGLIIDEVERLYSLSPRDIYPLPQRIRRLLPFAYIWGLGLISNGLIPLIDSNNLPKI